YWGPVLPLGLIFLLAAWRGSRWGFGLLRWFPWMGSMMRGYEAASYADLLALLIEHHVPFPESLTLAGAASGDPAFARSSRELAAAVERGLSPAEALQGSRGFPPLLGWLLATAPRQNDMVTALRQLATRYRSYAHFQAEKIRVFLPTILLFGIGATATVLYALALFVPLTTLWTSLARAAP
ncbi:MAG: type II secretion system F family protein, partial [Planctomycetia bacterium]|nr:type II secretion system F family protein [Planctomycetia bacterium]